MTDVPYRRKEVIGECVLYLGDCRDILPTLGPVDAVLTDPPYILDPTSRAKTDGFKRDSRWEIERKGLHLGFNVSDILIAPHVVSFCSKKQLAEYIAAADARGYVWTLLSWHKNNPTPLAKRNYLPDTEYIFHMWKDVELRGSYETKRKWYVTDVERHNIDHPTVKPVHIIKNLVENASAPGDAILDPFMGSGTTGVACAQLSRSFIGIEREPSYFDIACRRIEEAYKQPRLFEEPAPKPKQESFL